MNAACAERTFCACHDCRAFAFDAEGGAHRGRPITIRAERKCARAGYAPTHRSADQ